MIERKFVSQNMKEFQIKEYVANNLRNVGLSEVKLQRTPLGEKIIVTANRPGLVVGKAGSNIKKLTLELKEKFDLENPQIEIEEIKDPFLDPAVVAEDIASTLERYGTKQFKSAGHRALSNVMKAGALGVEILISGKIPSQRARTWRFYEGYLKKSGDISTTGVKVAYKTALLKTGTVGIKVSIMPSTIKLPDHIEFKEDKETIIEEVTEEASNDKETTEETVKEEKEEEKKEKKEKGEKEEKKTKKETTKKEKKTTKKKTTTKKTTTKKTAKTKEEVTEEAKDEVKEEKQENKTEEASNDKEEEKGDNE